MGTSENRKTFSPEIGDRLKLLRLEKNYTLVEVSERVGLSAQAIGLIEKAKRMPSVPVIAAYAKAFDVDLNELVELRKTAIINTVHLYGDDAPSAMKNEYETIRSSIFDPAAGSGQFLAQVYQMLGRGNRIDPLETNLTIPSYYHNLERDRYDVDEVKEESNQYSKNDESINELINLELTPEEIQLAKEYVIAIRKLKEQK